MSDFPEIDRFKAAVESLPKASLELDYNELDTLHVCIARALKGNDTQRKPVIVERLHRLERRIIELHSPLDTQLREKLRQIESCETGSHQSHIAPSTGADG